MAEEMHQKLAQAVIDGEPEDAEALAKEALAKGLDPLACITHGLTKGIQEVGKLFASGEYYLPELIIGADAMKVALEILEPMLVGDQKREVVGRVVLGTVEGDLHEIGKTLVGTMLIANGFQVTDIDLHLLGSEPPVFQLANEIAQPIVNQDTRFDTSIGQGVLELTQGL